MKKIKEFSKKYLIGFTLGLLTSGIVVVCAATYFPSSQTTYDNKVSGLKSTNVQGAIDELYNTCFPKAGEQIIENAGLEKDPYECRYFFTGATPNNYITFNNETWRILSVECDGTIKIIKDTNLEGISWDASSNNNWNRPATLNTYLNGTYYNNLNSTAKIQIVAKNWSIGNPDPNSTNLGNQINDENSKKWNGKIALPTVSEYIRTNSNTSSCGTFRTYNINYNSCKNTTWILNSNINNFWWTLSTYDRYVLIITTFGSIENGGVNTSYFLARPTLYLSSDIQIISGNGSSSSPYQIK